MAKKKKKAKRVRKTPVTRSTPHPKNKFRRGAKVRVQTDDGYTDGIYVVHRRGFVVIMDTSGRFVAPQLDSEPVENENESLKGLTEAIDKFVERRKKKKRKAVDESIITDDGDVATWTGVHAGHRKLTLKGVPRGKDPDYVFPNIDLVANAMKNISTLEAKLRSWNNVLDAFSVEVRGRYHHGQMSAEEVDRRIAEVMKQLKTKRTRALKSAKLKAVAEGRSLL